jgi:predicted dehydrogenase
VIRYGLIGAGGVGRKRAACLKPGQLVSVCDRESARAESLVAAAGQGRVVPQPEDIFRDPAVDAVLVSTRHDSLATLTLAAMEAGKSVMVEKPGARSVAELAPLLEAERACGVRVRVGYNHRFHPALLKARRRPPRLRNGMARAAGDFGRRRTDRPGRASHRSGPLVSRRFRAGARVRADAFLEHAGGGQRFP